jgi:hypothetical protein
LNYKFLKGIIKRRTADNQSAVKCLTDQFTN